MLVGVLRCRLGRLEVPHYGPEEHRHSGMIHRLVTIVANRQMPARGKAVSGSATWLQLCMPIDVLAPCAHYVVCS